MTLKTGFSFADRIQSLPPYLFAELDKMVQKAKAKGVDVVDLGVGDPDLPAPQELLERLAFYSREAYTHRYPSYQGDERYLKAVAEWFEKRFGVPLDYQSEVLGLIGSKEGIAHFPLAFVNPGEAVLVPSPGYPVYESASIFADGDVFGLPLAPENGFLPNFGKIPDKYLACIRLLFLNYPNNPTTAVAPRDFFKEVVNIARKHDIIVCHDMAYSELYFEEPPESILQTPGAKDVAVEMHSFSKSFNMTGFRLGFAVGNRQLLTGLGKIKMNIDSGAFTAIQLAGAELLNHHTHLTEDIRHIYKKRRDRFVESLAAYGINVEKPKATFYVWAEVPSGFTSMEYCALLLEKLGIVATPGNGFGEYGEGFIRFSLTCDDKQLLKANERLRNAGK